jgi:hypothetical protein
MVRIPRTAPWAILMPSSEEWNVRLNSSSRPRGPSAKREPSPEGLGYWKENPSAVGAALYHVVPPQLDFTVPGRRTTLSIKPVRR